MSTKNLPVQIPAAVKGVKLKIFVASTSSWDETDILNEITRANLIFSQCGFSFNEIELTKVDTRLKYFGQAELDAFLEVVHAKNKRGYKELSVFLVKGFKRDLHGQSIMGFARLRRNSGPFNFSGFAVINDRFLSADATQYGNADSSIFAHELGHLLLDDDHVNYKNFLADRSQLIDGHITPEQCKSINKDPYGFLPTNKL